MEAQEILKHLLIRPDAFGLQTHDGWKTVERQVRDEDLEAHTKGLQTLGFFALDKNSQTRWFAFDFDKDSPDVKSEVLWTHIQETEFASAAFMTSTGGRNGLGRHVFILVANMIPGSQARALGKKLLKGAGLADDVCDFFPAQSQLSGDKPFGNFIRAPFGYHQVAGAWFQLTHPASLATLTPVMLVPEEVVEQTITEPQIPQHMTLMATGDFPCWRLMMEGIPEGARDEAGLVLSQRLWRLLKNEDAVYASLISWNIKNRPPLEEKHLHKLVKQGSKPYELGCTSIQQNASIAAYCARDRCPLGRKQIALEQGGQELLEREDILKTIEHTLDYMIIGERSGKMTLFLVCLTTFYGDPMHAIIRSRTATGKSWCMNGVLKLFPSDLIIPFSRITTHFLEYSDLNLDGKIIAVDELDNVEEQGQLRLLLSEGRLRTGTLMKTEDGLQAQMLDVPGKATFISTTTELGGDEEFKNRTLTIPLDESQEQTDRILDKITEDNVDPPDDIDTSIIQNAFLALRKVKVLIPRDLAARIRQNYPSNVGYPRRDYKKLLALIKASAFLHQRQRPRNVVKNKEYVRATWQDLGFVLDYCLPALITTVQDLHPIELSAMQVVKELGEAGKDATYRLVSQKLTRSRRQVMRVLEHLTDLNILALDDSHRPHKYFIQTDVENLTQYFERMLTEAKKLASV